MNRLLKATMVVGVLLTARGVSAQESSDPAPRAITVTTARPRRTPIAEKLDSKAK